MDVQMSFAAKLARLKACVEAPTLYVTVPRRELTELISYYEDLDNKYREQASVEAQSSFLYCESTDGGMELIYFRDASELACLYGWMQQDCLEQDTRLVEWTKTAKIGEGFQHRLGYVVRTRD